MLARWRHRVPVRSVVHLLRPQAMTRHLTGGVRETLDERARLGFDYRLVRVWELPLETLLNGGLGTLPLAGIAAVDRPGLPAIVERMRSRPAGEVSPAQARELLLAARILLGLKCDRTFARALLKGVTDMEESATYVEIIEIGERRGEMRGEIEGRAEGERRLLVPHATRRFGPPGPAGWHRTLAVLEQLDDALAAATGWDAWLAGVGR